MRSWQLLVLAGAFVAAPARADGPADGEVASPAPPPTTAADGQWSVGVGGYSALTGPASWGPAASIELFPGGRFGRFGAGLMYRGFEGTDAGMAAAGVAYVGAAARPRLVLTLHAEVGASFPDPLPVIGGGIRTQLWLWGPLVLAADTGAHLYVDGLDSRLAIGTSLTLGLGR